MNQSGSTAKEKSCPVCGQEGQAITCTSGNRSEVIFYHPKKRFHTVCRIAGDEKKCEEADREAGEAREAREAREAGCAAI